MVKNSYSSEYETNPWDAKRHHSSGFISDRDRKLIRSVPSGRREYEYDPRYGSYAPYGPGGVQGPHASGPHEPHLFEYHVRQITSVLPCYSCDKRFRHINALFLKLLCVQSMCHSAIATANSMDFPFKDQRPAPYHNPESTKPFWLMSIFHTRLFNLPRLSLNYRAMSSFGSQT